MCLPPLYRRVQAYTECTFRVSWERTQRGGLREDFVVMVVLGFVLLAVTLGHAVSVRRWSWVVALSVSLVPLFLSSVGFAIAVVAAGSYVLTTIPRSQDRPEWAGRWLWVVLAFLLLAVLVVMPSVLFVGEQGGDDCEREYEERFPLDLTGVNVEGWSWRPYGVRCTIYRHDGTTVQIVAHPYW